MFTKKSRRLNYTNSFRRSVRDYDIFIVFVLVSKSPLLIILPPEGQCIPMDGRLSKLQISNSIYHQDLIDVNSTQITSR